MSATNGGNPRLDRIERLIEQTVVANKAAHAVHTREIREIRTEMRGWARAAVKESLSQRKRTGELDEKITQLAAAQLVTEEKLQRFISSVARGTNGH